MIFKLKENGIESRPFFLPVHNMPPYKECKHGNLDVTEELSVKGINLPSSVSLTEDDVIRICEVINDVK